ncbi:MAG TPA: class I SAM-dependent methyltransferase [Puia sp.]|nr:class I SAM-dependent methyltransferase [Puia sp.]
MLCRFDGLPLTKEFVDLGFSPPSNSFLTPEQLNQPEVYYPLKLFVSERSFLVQVDEHKKHDEIFTNDYVYFSSYSTSWLAHSKAYVEMMTKRFGFGPKSQVIEIASNDGYLLQYFKEKGIPVLGIEPTSGTAAAAEAKGVESWVEFFGVDLARKLVATGRQADLLLGNNVLAHVPDINDFVGGLRIALKTGGVITMEFPHLMQLVEHNQFDTIYHEHFSYLSLLAVKAIFAHHGLVIFDVEELPTHGGSLRIFARHQEDAAKTILPAVDQLLQKEIGRGMNTLAYYESFQHKVNLIKNGFLQFLLTAKQEGRSVAAYGAAAKGNTLLNYCGVKMDLIDFVVDANPFKQNKFLPGSHVPVVNEAVLKDRKPDYVVIFPWNIKDEIVKQLSYIRDWNGRFVTAIPGIQIF